MPNTSATGGALAPVGAQQPADIDLDVILQAVVAGVLNLPASLIRPRWQETPTPQPPRGTNWCAMGVTKTEGDTNPVLSHDSQLPEGAGQDIFIRHEQSEALCSLYGPNAVANAALLRDGLQVPQNTETLAGYGIAYVSSDRIVRVPDLVNQGWINRADIRLTFRRKITRTYPVLNLLSAAGVIDAGDLSQTFDVENSV